MRLFGTSGIRAIVDEKLVSLAFRAGLAAGKVYGNIIVAGDTRTSHDLMKHALISGVLASGARCSDAGMVPTPTLAIACREFGAGIMVTASHNPPEYNGIKMLNPDGSSFHAAQQEQMEAMILDSSLGTAPWTELKQAATYGGAAAQHLRRILQDFPEKFKLKVVLDCGGGAAAVITPHLLEEMGCDLVNLNCRTDGFFPRGIEPVAANLEELIRVTKESGAALGIAHDGDADRMMAVDDRGRFIPGDKLLVMLARALGAKEIITTIDASMAIAEAGYRVRQTRVGDTAVSEELGNGGDFGGEPSGSWVFPAVSLCPDGIYAAAMMVAIATRQSLAELADSIPAYPLLRGSVSTNGLKMSSLESGLMALEPLSVTNIDGIKLSFADGWLLVRASGTEPKIRLTAEAKTEARARQLYDSARRVIEDGAQGKEKVS